MTTTRVINVAVLVTSTLMDSRISDTVEKLTEGESCRREVTFTDFARTLERVTG